MEKSRRRRRVCRPGAVIVTDTLEAVLMLIGAWPTVRTDAHIAAVLSAATC